MGEVEWERQLQYICIVKETPPSNNAEESPNQNWPQFLQTFHASRLDKSNIEYYNTLLLLATKYFCEGNFALKVDQ